MKHGIKQTIRLADRRKNYDEEVSDKQGTKRPGSMNSHKSRSIKEFRTKNKNRTPSKRFQ